MEQKIIQLPEMKQILTNIWTAMKENRLQAQLLDDGRIKPTKGSRTANSCFYRVPEHPGCGCAIGVNIPDEDYMDEMEGKGIGHLFHGGFVGGDYFPFRFVTTTENSRGELSELQFRHDDWVADKNAKSYFMTYLRQLSEKYGLDESVMA